LLHSLYYRLPVCCPIEYSVSNTISPLSSKGFHCRYTIYYAFFYLSRQLKVFYIVEFLQISWPIIHNVNNGFLAVVIAIFLNKLTYNDHKMITEHHNSRSYDEVITKLQRICDNLWSSKYFSKIWPLMLFLLAYLYVHYLLFLSMVHEYAYFLWIY